MDYKSPISTDVAQQMLDNLKKEASISKELDVSSFYPLTANEIGDYKGGAKKMGALKDLSIQTEEQYELDNSSLEPVNRLYMINNRSVSSDTFIKELALELYNHSSIQDIRKTIDDICNDDDGKNMITLNDRNFFSYLTKSLNYDEIKDVKATSDGYTQHQLRNFEVSYDIEIPPLIRGLGIRSHWKHVKEAVTATSFFEAKHKVRAMRKSEGKRTKSFEAKEVFLVTNDEKV